MSNCIFLGDSLAKHWLSSFLPFFCSFFIGFDRKKTNRYLDPASTNRRRWKPPKNWIVGLHRGFLDSVNLFFHIKEGCKDELFCAILKYSGLTERLHYDDMSFSLSLATNQSGLPHSELRMALAATLPMRPLWGMVKSRNKGGWSLVCNFSAERGNEKHREGRGKEGENLGGVWQCLCSHHAIPVPGQSAEQSNSSNVVIWN